MDLLRVGSQESQLIGQQIKYGMYLKHLEILHLHIHIP
jgi:hypothetical protein